MAPFANTLFRDQALADMGLVPHTLPAGGASEAVYRKASCWRMAWVCLAIGLAAIIGLFRDTVGSMVVVWMSSTTFNHAFLIPPICIYLIWIGRGKLAIYEPRPSLWGVAIVALAAFGWLAGNIASVRVVEHFALLGMIEGLFLAVLGWRAACAIAFPLLYLAFAVPFGEFLIAPLQDLTAVFVVKALRVIGIPVYLEGIFLTIPNARFEVAEACSGVRFLIATIALGALFAHLTFRSYGRFAAFMVLSFVVPIVANWFRALGIVMIAHFTDSKYAVGADHIIYGWVFFSFVTIILLSIGMAMREKPLNPDQEDAMSARAGMAAGPGGTPRVIAGVAALCLVVASTAPAFELLSRSGGGGTGRVSLTLSGLGGGWRPAPELRTTWRPKFPSADAELYTSYENDGRNIQFYIAYYHHQMQGKEIVGDANTIADGRQWYRTANRSATVQLDGRPLNVNVTRMLRGDRGRLAINWYWVGGQFTANRYFAKFLQVKSRLFGGTDAAAVIVVSARYDQLPREAETLMQNFLDHAGSVREVLESASRN